MNDAVRRLADHVGEGAAPVDPERPSATVIVANFCCHDPAAILQLLTPMTFWRNIASLAARRVDDAACAECPPGLPGEDPAFSTAVTALGAKLAKADGRR